MRNFILGVLVALAFSCMAVTVHDDGSETYTREEVGNIKENLDNMAAEIGRLEGEFRKANRFFLMIKPIIKNCKPKEAEM